MGCGAGSAKRKAGSRHIALASASEMVTCGSGALPAARAGRGQGGSPSFEAQLPAFGSPQARRERAREPLRSECE